MGAVQPNLRIIAEKLDAFPLFLKPYKIEIHLRSVVSLLPIHRTTLKSGEIVLTFPCRFRRIYRIAPMLVRNSAIHCTSAVGIWEFDSSEFVSSVSARFVPGPLGLDWQIQTERRAITEAISSMNALDDELARQRRQAIEYFLLLIFHRRPRDEHDELRALVNEHLEHPTEKEEAKNENRLSVKRDLRIATVGSPSPPTGGDNGCGWGFRLWEGKHLWEGHPAPMAENTLWQGHPPKSGQDAPPTEDPPSTEVAHPTDFSLSQKILLPQMLPLPPKRHLRRPRHPPFPICIFGCRSNNGQPCSKVEHRQFPLMNTDGKIPPKHAPSRFNAIGT